jgi:hypothetical protein
VSPSWRDRIEIFLAPDRVDLTRIARGLSPKPGLAHAQACDAGANQGDWRPAVEALGGALASLAWRNADAQITLSHHFVRLALVPGIRAAANREERLELARHQLRTIYAERADAWQVALGEAGADAGIAAAIDRELATALRDALAPASIALVGMKPFLADAFNSARAVLGPEAAWLAVAEPGRVCVAHLEGERWTALRSQRAVEPLAEALAAALEQTRLASGIEAMGEVCLVTRDPAPADLVRAGDWTVRALAPRVAGESVNRTGAAAA